MDSLRFAGEEDLQTDIGVDIGHSDDSIDISQLEGYLRASCSEDYAGDVAVIGQPTLHPQGFYAHHQSQQLLDEPPAGRSGLLPLASSHISFVSHASSTDALLAMPESPPYSSGSEPYSPEQLAATVAHQHGVGALSSRMPAVPGSDFLLPVPYAGDSAADMASVQKSGRAALYTTAAAVPRPSHVAVLSSNSDGSSIGSSRSRCGATAGKRRKTSAAAGGPVDAGAAEQSMVGGDLLLPDATQLLLRESPLPHLPHRRQQLGAAGREESGNPNHDVPASGATITDDLDENPYVMDINLRPIKWQKFEGGKAWCQLLDATGVPVKLELYDVDADKGFNFSPVDDSFVCQKKNHFQVTSTIAFSSCPTLFCLPDGSLHPLEGLYYHFYGVKKEAVKQIIRVEQSQSDRSKRPFQPISVSLVDGKSAKATVGRLHFTETTINNMRKKGKPNPDQRYFLLVSGIYAHSTGLQPVQCPVIEMASEKIIVRASNPGQFESDIEIPWHKSGGIESIYHYGTVGINTDKPDEALVVNGNMKLMGNIVQPSDERVKEKIEEVDTREQLARLAQLRMYRFKFRPDFGAVAGLGESDLDLQTGVLAQELRSILPEAVRDAGDVTLANGEYIENLLVVNKDRLFMESVGAVKELCKVTETLESRMHEIEKVNRKLAELKRLGSIKSARSDDRSTTRLPNGAVGPLDGRVASKTNDDGAGKSNGRNNTDGSVVLSVTRNENKKPFCTDKAIRTIVAVLIVTMMICLAAIVALYMIEKPLLTGEASNSRLPQLVPTANDGVGLAASWSRSPTTVKSTSTVPPTSKSGRDYYSSACAVPSISPASATCCGSDSSPSCTCHTCPYVPLASFAEAQWLLGSPAPSPALPLGPVPLPSSSTTPASVASARRRRQSSANVSADYYDLFKEVNFTLRVDGDTRVITITRNMCVNCLVCRRSCSNLTVLLLVHASVSAISNATLQFSSTTNMLATFRGLVTKNFNGTCSNCSTLPSTSSPMHATTAANSNLPAGSGSDGSNTSVLINTLDPSSSKMSPRLMNATYTMPATFRMPIGAFSRQLYAFRIACADSRASACQMAVTGRTSIDLYLDIMRSCNTCADGTLNTARQSITFLHNVLQGENRRR